MNIKLAEKVIQELAIKGVHSFCMCPGGRLAPFVEVLSHSKGLNVLSFFEERSAGFFALGRVRKEQKPIAVLSTSGTAVAELLPSVIEAHYSALPLVLITSDRPLECGKQGTPQTLKNTLEILKNYCRLSKNILKLEDVNLSDWNPSEGSLHLNVCFDEPLIDSKIKSLDFSNLKTKSLSIYPSADLSFENNQTSASGFKNTSNKQKSKEKLEDFFKKCKKPLVLVGELRAKEQNLVKDTLTSYKGLFYTEPLSGLENIAQQLVSGEKILNYALEKEEIDGVIRIGGIPRSRFWRDLEKHKIPVLNLSSPPFYTGLSRPSFNIPLLSAIENLKSYLLSLKEYGTELKNFDESQLKKWKDILNSHPQSEEFWFWTLKKSIKNNSKVFLGNSNPIRLWDMLAFEKKENLSITAQSGVNGIEGLLSRFLGECESKRDNVGIIGDLSLLYDMAGFWKAKELPPWTLIVINNTGGQIFSRLFNNKAFLNSHNLSFSPLAEMWGLHYESYKNSSDFHWSGKAYSLLEICPSLEDTKNCFQKYVSIWNS